MKNNYEPFYSSYTRIKYNDYKSEKLTTHSDIRKERIKALDEGVEEIVVIDFVKQSNGGYEGKKEKYYYTGQRWKRILV